MSSVEVRDTAIEGLLVVRSPVHADDRGWFTEAWQREKMCRAGLPDFGPVQHNLAVSRRGATRGIHAEPWDKLVTVAAGSAHGAWVDLRPGPGFGVVVELPLAPGTIVYVPRGVANSYQVLSEEATYAYLVNEHWRPESAYVGVHPGDPALGIGWPIPLEDAVLSAKDRAQAPLAGVEPVPPRRTLVLGATGAVGRCLLEVFPDAVAVGREQLDLSDPAAVAAWPWEVHDLVINAAAFTAVDDAETTGGRRQAWAVNAVAPAMLAELTAARGAVLVHFSTDYVYGDGAIAVDGHAETDPLVPLGAYAASKAAGDLAVGRHPRHYLLRTSWVVGGARAGSDFVSTMRRLAQDGVSPTVVDDQVGRLTFAADLARATAHLLEARAAYGTYHVTGGGPPTSWAEVAREVFAACGRDPEDVTPVTTEAYESTRGDRVVAPRPRRSTLDLAKLRATGFEPTDAVVDLRRHLAAAPR